MTSNSAIGVHAWTPGAVVSAVPFAFLILMIGSTEAARSERAALPPQLDRYLAETAKLSSDERQRLLNGDPVAKLLDVHDAAEVAAFGAVWIDAPLARYVDALKDIERFESGGAFKITRRLSTPPKKEDFAELRLPDDDLNDLRSCRVGDCKIKLPEQVIQKLQTGIDWDAPDAHASANALMQQFALDCATGYLEGGNERLPVYRDGSKPVAVAKEFRAMTDRMPELTKHLRSVHTFLLDYPKVTLPDATSMLYWQEVSFGLKPTIRLSHLTIREEAADTVVTSKMIYATHYFRTALELRSLIPDRSRGNGFWLVTVNRSRPDGLDGTGSGIIRRRVRGQVKDAAEAGLLKTKQRFETQ